MSTVIKCKRPKKELTYTEEKMCDSSTRFSYSVIQQLLEKELHCAICHEIVICSSVLHCGHIFCTYCIHKWLRCKAKCPLCFKPCHRHISLKNLDNLIGNIYELIMPKCLQNERCKEIESRQQIPIETGKVTSYEINNESQISESDSDSINWTQTIDSSLNTSILTTTTSSTSSSSTDLSYSST
ncbi:unnamed protein product [Heterobilharzia americana]|nr:unnamed protein product [Heterobilharzia americana]CAH8501421.1 unnamed protein product [Heterobilharzia americana]